jgi:hypothetical protein
VRVCCRCATLRQYVHQSTIEFQQIREKLLRYEQNGVDELKKVQPSAAFVSQHPGPMPFREHRWRAQRDAVETVYVPSLAVIQVPREVVIRTALFLSGGRRLSSHPLCGETGSGRNGFR